MPRAIATVMSRPPDGRIRTNRVSPAACTTMFVTWAPTSTTASPPLVSSSIPAPVAPTARTSANGTRSSPTGSSFALVAAAMSVSTIAFCAATNSRRSI